MTTRTVKPNPAPARDAVIGLAQYADRTHHGMPVIEILPEPVKVIDFYPLTPSRQQRTRHAN